MDHPVYMHDMQDEENEWKLKISKNTSFTWEFLFLSLIKVVEFKKVYLMILSVWLWMMPPRLDQGQVEFFNHDSKFLVTYFTALVETFSGHYNKISLSWKFLEIFKNLS